MLSFCSKDEIFTDPQCTGMQQEVAAANCSSKPSAKQGRFADCPSSSEGKVLGWEREHKPD